MDSNGRARRPAHDVVAEASSILAAAERQQLPLRAIGGVAIRLRSAETMHPAFARGFHDIDFVTSRKASGHLDDLFESLGYGSDTAFNTVNSGYRAVYLDHVNERQVDVFVESFEMCHDIPLSKRMLEDPMTIPLAELLLTKLQIFEINEKDQRDICALLFYHRIAEEDGDAINCRTVAQLCAADWGLWRTTQLNVDRLRAAVTGFDLSSRDSAVILDRLATLCQRIESEPKTRRWKLRERIGDRRKWYRQPEEDDE